MRSHLGRAVTSLNVFINAERCLTPCVRPVRRRARVTSSVPRTAGAPRASSARLSSRRRPASLVSRLWGKIQTRRGRCGCEAIYDSLCSRSCTVRVRSRAVRHLGTLDNSKNQTVSSTVNGTRTRGRDVLVDLFVHESQNLAVEGPLPSREHALRVLVLYGCALSELHTSASTHRLRIIRFCCP